MKLAFTTDPDILKETLKNLQVSLKKKPHIKFNILPGEVEISVPGASSLLHAKTEGKGTVILPSPYITNLLKNYRLPEISFSFENGKLLCGSFSLSGIIIRDFGEDNNQQQLELPLNFTKRDILRLTIKHTPDYLSNHNLWTKVKKTKKQKAELIQKAHVLLLPLGVRLADLEDLVERSVYGPFEG